MNKFKRFGFLAVVASLVLASCGGSDDGGGEVAKGIAATFMEEDSGFSQDEADCAGEAIVSDIGSDRLDELGVVAGNIGEIDDVDFTDEEIATIGSSVAGCIGGDFIARSLLADGDFTEEQAECIGDAFEGDTLQEVAGSMFGGGSLEDSPELLVTMMTAFTECGVSLTG